MFWAKWNMKLIQQRKRILSTYLYPLLMVGAAYQFVGMRMNISKGVTDIMAFESCGMKKLAFLISNFWKIFQNTMTVICTVLHLAAIMLC